jgi:hypothetical protein
LRRGLIVRNVNLVVGNKPIGSALTWAYPNGKHHGVFQIPTYELTVTGADDNGMKRERKFEVIRFGVQGKTSKSSPIVVGLANFQVHVITAWLPDYFVHSAISVEKGAWQVYGNFLIHDGPDNPKIEVYASIGCIEICNGPRGFDIFNDFLISLSGPKSANRADQLAEIGRAKSMSITYLKASRPLLVKA